MSLNFNEVNVLGNIINDTYGKGSTDSAHADGRYSHFNQQAGHASSVVTKSSLQGEILTVTALSIVNLTSPSTQHLGLEPQRHSRIRQQSVATYAL